MLEATTFSFSLHYSIRFFCVNTHFLRLQKYIYFSILIRCNKGYPQLFYEHIGLQVLDVGGADPEGVLQDGHACEDRGVVGGVGDVGEHNASRVYYKGVILTPQNYKNVPFIRQLFTSRSPPFQCTPQCRKSILSRILFSRTCLGNCQDVLQIHFVSNSSPKNTEKTSPQATT